MAKILVIDDESSYRRYISAALKLDGHEVRSAATAKEAIDLSRAFMPDFVVVDLVLGEEQTGIDVFRTLRSERPQLEGLLITGLARSDLRADAEQAQLKNVLDKPFLLGELTSLVAEATRTP